MSINEQDDKPRRRNQACWRVSKCFSESVLGQIIQVVNYIFFREICKFLLSREAKVKATITPGLGIKGKMLLKQAQRRNYNNRKENDQTCGKRQLSITSDQGVQL